MWPCCSAHWVLHDGKSWNHPLASIRVIAMVIIYATVIEGMFCMSVLRMFLAYVTQTDNDITKRRLILNGHLIISLYLFVFLNPWVNTCGISWMQWPRHGKSIGFAFVWCQYRSFHIIGYGRFWFSNPWNCDRQIQGMRSLFQKAQDHSQDMCCDLAKSAALIVRYSQKKE